MDFQLVSNCQRSLRGAGSGVPGDVGSLSAVINGVTTNMMFILIARYLAGLTDGVVSGKVNQGFYPRVLVWMVLSRLAGTVFAQILLLPATLLIAAVTTRPCLTACPTPAQVLAAGGSGPWRWAGFRGRW